MIRIRPLRLLILATLLGIALTGVHAATAPSAAKPVKPSAPAPPPPPPAIELVESVPIESSLGNPKLRHAAEVWVELIRSATSRLDIEQFYFSTWPGEPMDPVVQAMVEAAKRGVRVHLLLDAKMYKTYPQPAESLAHVPGITVRTIDIGKIAGGVQHSKYFIVDGATVFLGSQNFDWRALQHIHELGVCVRDERVAMRFQQVFDMDWAVAELQQKAGADSSQMVGWPAPPPLSGDLPVKVVQSPGDTALVWPSWSPRAFSPDSTLWDRDAIVRDIDAARSEVVLQSMRYAPQTSRLTDDALDKALRRAAARGVAVRMIISDWQAGTDGMRWLDSLSIVPNVEVRLSSVPEWSKAYIPYARLEHCKYMVVDTTLTWVGTSNWEPSYFHNTRNLAVTMKNRPLAVAARDIFTASWTAAAPRPVRLGVKYPERIHGDTPPPGVAKYGR